MSSQWKGLLLLCSSLGFMVNARYISHTSTLTDPQSLPQKFLNWMTQAGVSGHQKIDGTMTATSNLHARTMRRSIIEVSSTLKAMTILGGSEKNIGVKGKVFLRERRARQMGLAPWRIPGLAYSKRRLYWLLMSEGYSAHLTVAEQRDTLRFAFRLWSEVIPIHFDEGSPGLDIDIKLGFGTGRHFGCPRVFDREGQELAHAGPHGEIHFNDDQHFTTSDYHGVSLLKVAVHEIGHVLGLQHSSRADSVMFPSYSTEGSWPELDASDRNDIQQLYGVCEDPFDAVFDWIRPEWTPHGVPLLRFNTFFFRRSWFWMYENRNNRTRYRDPQPISRGWEGLLVAHLDAALHIWNSAQHLTYFFTGVHYWLFDVERGMVFSMDSQGRRFPQVISEGFPGISGPVDTAFYNKTAQTVYFFTGDTVTVFNVPTNRLLSGFPRKISEVFPAVLPGDHLMGNLDAAYYSYTHQALFLFKGIYYWKVVGDQERKQDPGLPSNGLLPKQRVSEQWFDICDITPD